MQPPGSAKALSRGLTQAPRHLPRPIPRYWSRHSVLPAQPHLHQEVSTGWILKHADIKYIPREPPQFLEMKRYSPWRSTWPRSQNGGWLPVLSIVDLRASTECAH